MSRISRICCCFPFLVLVIGLLIDGYEGRVTAHVTGGAVQVDSFGKRPDSLQKREISTTPRTWTPHQLDSLLKHVTVGASRIDSAGRHKYAEHMASILRGSHYYARDSSFVLRDTGCLKWMLLPGITAVDPDTIVLVDTCRSPCEAWRTIPLGCWDSVLVEIQHPIARYVCDTTCRTVAWVYHDTSYYLVSDADVLSMRVAAGGKCWYSSYSTVCLKRMPHDTIWVVNAKEFSTTYPRYACPIGTLCTDSTICCLPISVVYSYVTKQQMVLHESSWLTYDTLNISCGEAWKYSVVLRDTSNCRYDTTWTTERKLEGQFVPAGRDTTVYLPDTCSGCWKVYSVCDGVGRDSSFYMKRWVYNPVYERDTVYDTIQVQRIYCTWDGVYEPVDMYRMIPCAVADSIIAASPILSRTYFPSSLKIEIVRGISCMAFVSCSQAECPGGGSDCWFVPAGMVPQQYRPTCNSSARCYAFCSAYYLNWRCSHDTTISILCRDPESDSVYYVDTTVVVPDMSGTCPDSVKMEINYRLVGYDSTLVDSVLVYVRYLEGYRYRIVYEDTCYCPERLICASNGCRYPCVVFVKRECDPQPYWKNDTLVFPCETNYSVNYLSLWRAIEEIRDSINILSGTSINILSGTMILPEDSAVINIDGINEESIVYVSYANNERFVCDPSDTMLGWAIWGENQLTIFGKPEKKVLYVIYR